MRRKLWFVVRTVVLAAGALAVLLLMSAQTSKPAACLVQVEGMSMYPTLQPGNELLFARLPFEPGDIVLADVGESFPVIKRVDDADRRIITLVGDNRGHSENYRVLNGSILAVMVCRVPFSSPLRDMPARTSMLACGAGGQQ